MIEHLIRDALIDGSRVRAAIDVPPRSSEAAELKCAMPCSPARRSCSAATAAAPRAPSASPPSFVGRFVVEQRAAMPRRSRITVDSSALTAIANDYGYEHVFSRQVEALGAEGDVLVAITTSGTSKNVLAAVAVARSRGMKILALTGARGADFVASCDAGVAVPSTNTARIQELHITIGHVLCEAVDEAFAPSIRQVHAAHHKEMSLV